MVSLSNTTYTEKEDATFSSYLKLKAAARTKFAKFAETFRSGGEGGGGGESRQRLKY